jgi:hypothetical protein
MFQVFRILLHRAFYSVEYSSFEKTLSGHGILSFCCGILSFFVSLSFLNKDSILSFNSDNGLFIFLLILSEYSTFKIQVDLWLEDNLYNVRFPKDSLLFKLILSTFCGWISFIIYQPCLNFMKCFNRMSKFPFLNMKDNTLMKKLYKTNSFFWRILNYFNFILPISFVILCFSNQVNSLKIILLFFFITLRMSFIRLYVQRYEISIEFTP